MNSRKLLLASASPRRRELLSGAGFTFEVVPSHIDESPLPAELPRDHALRLACEKAAWTSAHHPGCVVLAADTIVVLDDSILAKPADPADARRMLRALSGRPHTVMTGVCVRSGGREDAWVEETRVEFRKLSDADIDAYVATGEPMDKAGAYGIQGGAAHMVLRIEGSYTNVVGLPLAQVVEHLRRMGV